jgi:hypothetical protein
VVASFIKNFARPFYFHLINPNVYFVLSSNNEQGSKADVMRDLLKGKRSSPSDTNKTYKNSDGSGLDHRKSQFKDLMKYIVPAELSRPVQGHLRELDVTVMRLRNVSLR